MFTSRPVLENILRSQLWAFPPHQMFSVPHFLDHRFRDPPRKTCSSGSPTPPGFSLCFWFSLCYCILLVFFVFLVSWFPPFSWFCFLLGFRGLLGFQHIPVKASILRAIWGRKRANCRRNAGSRRQWYHASPEGGLGVWREGEICPRPTVIGLGPKPRA